MGILALMNQRVKNLPVESSLSALLELLRHGHARLLSTSRSEIFKAPPADHGSQNRLFRSFKIIQITACRSLKRTWEICAGSSFSTIFGPIDINHMACADCGIS